MNGQIPDPEHAQNPWSRKHDDPAGVPTIASPKARYYSEPLKELFRIVQIADNSPDPKPEVRACGSHWSLQIVPSPRISLSKPMIRMKHRDRVWTKLWPRIT